MTVSSSITLPRVPRIRFGASCASAAAADLANAGYRAAFIVCSPSVRPLANPFIAALRQAGATVEIAENVPPEPTAGYCETLRARARPFAPDLVLAVGGGSVLDVAKLVAALHDRDEPVSTFYGIDVLATRRSGLVCIPTTSGTGSEVSPNALLFDEPSIAKKAVISPALIPDVAILDPELTRTLPPALTATTGIDALAHCLETYASRVAHPLVDLRSLDGVRLIGTHLARCVENGDDITARSAVALGSLYGGLGLGPVNTNGVHALAYPLGGEFHLAHGLSIALLLPHVVRFNLASMPERHAALAEALGAASVSDLPDALSRLIARCGIDARLSAYGIPRVALPRLAEAGLQVTRLLKSNPREIQRTDALRIYDAAF